MPFSNFQPIKLLDPDCCYKFTYSVANSADPDQLASSEANWSGSTLFAQAGYIRVQQDKGSVTSEKFWQHNRFVISPHLHFLPDHGSYWIVRGWFDRSLEFKRKQCFLSRITNTTYFPFLRSHVQSIWFLICECITGLRFFRHLHDFRLLDFDFSMYMLFKRTI